MSVGLLALLDDVAAIVKMSAASLDDIVAQSAKAGSKAVGVVIDDTAVTPKYVTGLSPARELPIVYNIAKGSLKNKLFILVPAMLALGAAAPFLIGPLLIFGGLFLAYEGYEKLHDVMIRLFRKEKESDLEAIAETISPEELEKIRTAGAIRTDFILSAEITALSYATINSPDLIKKALILVIVSLGITVAVYGTVGLIVKADDFGMYLAKKGRTRAVRNAGVFLVRIMPSLLKGLGAIGTAAMLWVGGGIIIHNIPALHHMITEIVNVKFALTGFPAWLAEAVMSGIFAIAAGFLVAIPVGILSKIKVRKKTGT